MIRKSLEGWKNIFISIKKIKSGEFQSLHVSASYAKTIQAFCSTAERTAVLKL